MVITQRSGLFLPAVLVWMLLGPCAAHADTSVQIYDFSQGHRYDITGFISARTGLNDIECAVAVNLDHFDGDELILAAGSGMVAVLSLPQFTLLGQIPESALRELFQLPAGTGTLSAVTIPGADADQLLYRDTLSGTDAALDFNTGTFGRYTGPPLPVGFVTGFSMGSLADTGLLHKHPAGDWSYESFGGGSPVPVPMTQLMGSDPMHVSELEWPGESGVAARFLLAVTEGAPPPTATPTPGGPPTVTPTPSAGPGFRAAVVNGLGEDIWLVNGGDYSVIESAAATGQSPNQAERIGHRLAVVNSLSNSISLYTVPDCQPETEISVGAGRNPFLMDCLDPDSVYVSNLLTNTVSLVRFSTASVITEISLPEWPELPHDPDTTTWARPGGIRVVNSVCYVACANLDSLYTAGGPGVVAEIDTGSQAVTGWFETGGRNTVDVDWDPRWPDRLWVVSAGDYTPGTGFAGNGSLSIWSISQAQMQTILPMTAAPMEIDIGADRAYLANAMATTVERVDLASLNLLEPVTLPESGPGMDYVSGLRTAPDGTLWVLTFHSDMLHILNPAQNDALLRSIPMGDGPDALAFVE